MRCSPCRMRSQSMPVAGSAAQPLARPPWPGRWAPPPCPVHARSAARLRPADRRHNPVPAHRSCSRARCGVDAVVERPCPQALIVDSHCLSLCVAGRRRNAARPPSFRLDAGGLDDLFPAVLFRAMKPSNSAGVPPWTMPPCCASCCFTSGSASAAFSASFRRRPRPESWPRPARPARRRRRCPVALLGQRRHVGQDLAALARGHGQRAQAARRPAAPR